MASNTVCLKPVGEIYTIAKPPRPPISPGALKISSVKPVKLSPHTPQRFPLDAPSGGLGVIFATCITQPLLTPPSTPDPDPLSKQTKRINNNPSSCRPPTLTPSPPTSILHRPKRPDDPSQQVLRSKLLPAPTMKPVFRWPMRSSSLSPPPPPPAAPKKPVTPRPQSLLQPTSSQMLAPQESPPQLRRTKSLPLLPSLASKAAFSSPWPKRNHTHSSRSAAGRAAPRRQSHSLPSRGALHLYPPAYSSPYSTIKEVEDNEPSLLKEKSSLVMERMKMIYASDFGMEQEVGAEVGAVPQEKTRASWWSMCFCGRRR